VLSDAADSSWQASVWLMPDDGATALLDFEHDGIQPVSSAPLRWSIEAANGDAFAKRWNPSVQLSLRSEVVQPRTVVARCVECSEPMFLVGETQVVPLDDGGAVVQLDGMQHWQVCSALELPKADQNAPMWRAGPGFVWVPDADELTILNVLGQVVEHTDHADGAPLTHSLPRGLYVLRVRRGPQWTQIKTILTP
jgi:hypothetical protein